MMSAVPSAATVPSPACAGEAPDPPRNGPGERKRALEAMLQARRLASEPPPLRGEDRRLRPLGTGIAAVDTLLGGGFPRGQLSELHGPASSGRTGLMLAAVAQVTRGGALAALVDAQDGFDPASAAASGVDLSRLLWLRGRAGSDVAPAPLTEVVAAVATLAGSGLFDLVALDLVHAARALRTLPATTWLRLQRLVEGTPTALLIVGEHHVACSPGGAALSLEPAGAHWSSPPGPARLLQALVARASSGRHALRHAADVALPALA
jgi:hypothetical protein